MKPTQHSPQHRGISVPHQSPNDCNHNDLDIEKYNCIRRALTRSCVSSQLPYNNSGGYD